MKILHLSDTTLSGSPHRLSNLINKYTEHESTHVVWDRVIGYRTFPCDIVGPEAKPEELQKLFDEADVIHYHNRYKRQEIFKRIKFKKKPSVIQIHSPRLSEDFTQEVDSGIPLAIIAQYHPRQWEHELTYIIPNVVDIWDPIHHNHGDNWGSHVPIVGYAPSNTHLKDCWDDKGYYLVNPYLKKLWMVKRKIDYRRIVSKPFLEAMMLKASCNIGIDEVMTGSYHLSSLEFLSLGCATFAYLDGKTTAVLKETLGCDTLPWINVDRSEFIPRIRKMMFVDKDWDEHGKASRKWMEKYFEPKRLCQLYIDMYEDILEKQS